MHLTPNYNLKKPEGTDPVDIQDFNDNADILDAELNKKADSAGGDISNMTIKALEEPAGTQFPVPEAGETSKSFLGKIRKFMNDFKSWNTGVCMIGQIVNNCVTNNDKLPLSAAQGKVLMDLYSVLNTNLTTKVLNCEIITNDNFEVLYICASRSGNIVQLSGSIIPKNTASAWTRIISGTPIPTNSGSNIFLTASEAGKGYDAAVKLYVSIDTGDIYARSGKTDVTVDFSWTYIVI